MTQLGQLTDLQALVLSGVTDALEQHGRPVTAEEVAEALGRSRFEVEPALYALSLQPDPRLVRHRDDRLLRDASEPASVVRPDRWSLPDRSEG